MTRDIASYPELPTRPRVAFELDLDDSTRPERPAAVWESKLGGTPYRPAGASWPATDDGEPLGFVAQLDLAEVEQWRANHGVGPILAGALPKTGMLQFFAPLDHSWNTCGVYLWPEVNRDPNALAEPVVAFRRDNDAAIEFGREETTVRRGSDGIALPADNGGSMLDCPRVGIRLLPVMRDPAEQRPLYGDRDLPDEVADELEALEGSGQLPPGLEEPQESIQLGGYADWVQDDPRGEDSPEVLLFQLGYADGRGGTMIGDAGCAYFLIDPTDLARGDFSSVRLSWASS